jgi:hypothetical protein
LGAELETTYAMTKNDAIRAISELLETERRHDHDNNINWHLLKDEVTRIVRDINQLGAAPDGGEGELG